eukprot:scaffold133101_cov37-Tisochrysis_lutea.AAC.2
MAQSCTIVCAPPANSIRLDAPMTPLEWSTSTRTPGVPLAQYVTPTEPPASVLKCAPSRSHSACSVTNRPSRPRRITDGRHCSISAKQRPPDKRTRPVLAVSFWGWNALIAFLARLPSSRRPKGATREPEKSGR